MPEGREGYQPGSDERDRAERSMTDEQRKSTEIREFEKISPSSIRESAQVLFDQANRTKENAIKEFKGDSASKSIASEMVAYARSYEEVGKWLMSVYEKEDIETSPNNTMGYKDPDGLEEVENYDVTKEPQDPNAVPFDAL